MQISTTIKNQVLLTLIDLLRENSEAILSANERDVKAYDGADESMHDRLKLSPAKVEGMIAAIEEIMALPDPVGQVIFEHAAANGMKVTNMAVPFGTILIIYESRPDVTIEAAITAFKAGNTILLKGGKEAKESNLVLVSLWHKALEKHGLDENLVQYLALDREATQSFIKDRNNKIDLIIPRGGDKLIAFVEHHAHAPVLVSGRGNNFLLVNEDADLQMAISIIVNGKNRVSVCNALDKVIVLQGRENTGKFVNEIADALVQNNIEITATEDLLPLLSNMAKPATKEEWKEEYLAPKIMLLTAKDIDEAIKIINENSGGHSAVIVTASEEDADYFIEEVDCAAVYHNASSRFTDGGQFGLGAEMAISTQKLHARGPVSLAHLVTNKWVIKGDGQVRG